MIQILLIICAIAIVGMIVTFISKLEMIPLFKNLIYLVVGIAIVLLVMHSLLGGHLPTIKL